TNIDVIIKERGEKMSETVQSDILNYFKESGTKPLSVHDLEDIFSMQETEDFKTLVKALNVLEQTGQLIRTRKNRYALPENMNLISRKIDMIRKGFVSIIHDKEQAQDVYIHETDLKSTMHNDIVIVRLEKKGMRDNRPEGVVIRVLERANQQIVGTFE